MTAAGWLLVASYMAKKGAQDSQNIHVVAMQGQQEAHLGPVLD